MLSEPSEQENRYSNVGSRRSKPALGRTKGADVRRARQYHYQVEPEGGLDRFANKFFHPMLDDPSINGERFRAELLKLAQSGAPVDLCFAAMTIACAYCVDVVRLLRECQRERAWWSMSEARYWCGVTLANRGLEAARLATITATRKATARKAATVGVTQRLVATKEEAFRLARELRPQETSVRSR